MTAEIARAGPPARVERDLEAIVTLMEVAALSLTDREAATFSFEDLSREVARISGEEVTIDDRDLRIVVESSSCMRKRSGRWFLQ